MKIAALLIAVITFGSFLWAIGGYFYRGTAPNNRLKWLEWAAAVSASMHAVALQISPAEEYWRWLAAIVVYATALALFWWAIFTVPARTLHLAFSALVPAQLVTRGPFHWIRHPFYASYLLAWFGGLVASHRWWLLPSIVVMGWIYVCAAREEETLLATGTSAKAYSEYRRSTGMFWPRLRAPLASRDGNLDCYRGE